MLSKTASHIEHRNDVTRDRVKKATRPVYMVGINFLQLFYIADSRPVGEKGNVNRLLFWLPVTTHIAHTVFGTQEVDVLLAIGKAMHP